MPNVNIEVNFKEYFDSSGSTKEFIVKLCSSFQQFCTSRWMRFHFWTLFENISRVRKCKYIKHDDRSCGIVSKKAHHLTGLLSCVYGWSTEKQETQKKKINFRASFSVFNCFSSKVFVRHRNAVLKILISSCGNLLMSFMEFKLTSAFSLLQKMTNMKIGAFQYTSVFLPLHFFTYIFL